MKFLGLENKFYYGKYPKQWEEGGVEYGVEYVGEEHCYLFWEKLGNFGCDKARSLAIWEMRIVLDKENYLKKRKSRLRRS
jgi:hypothetical protein